MSVNNKNYISKNIIFLAIISVLYMPLANATEWKNSFEFQSGFSEFAPPAKLFYSSQKKEKKKWRSGSSFNEINKSRYVPVTSKNPWKVTGSMRYKKSFNSQRPWGNIPDRKIANNVNMKLHDERFKQWSHRMDGSYRNDLRVAKPFNMFRQALPLPVNGYAPPGLMYGGPMLTPSFIQGNNLHRVGYGAYQVNPYSFSGLSYRQWGW